MVTCHRPPRVEDAGVGGGHEAAGVQDGRAADRGHHDADGVGLLEGRGAGVLPCVALLRLPRLIKYFKIFL